MGKSLPEKSFSEKSLSGKSFMEESLRNRFTPLTEDQLKTYSPLSFAYMGDAVYELVIRTMIVTRGNTKPNRYHHEVTEYVNAASQTALMEAIKPDLTEEEMKIFRRGLNAKPATKAKNQTNHDYRVATGFETLMGYLYLSGQKERILELVEHGLAKKE